MFTPSTWYFLSREIVDIWKQLEEKTNEQQTHQLTKYANSPSNWYKKQLEGIPNFQKVIEKLGDEELKRINKASEKAIKKAIDLVDNETLKSFRGKETKQEIRQDKERFIASSVKKVINQNEGKMNAFIRNASVRNGEFINKINVKKESTAKIRTQFTVNTKTQELYDIIRKQTEEGIQKGVPFTYSNGRRVPFKAHMEMSIRTTIQNEALERMTTAASNLGIIFYLASEHADSADDHAPYQGKVYVLENWESKITDSETREKVRNFIREKDIRTIEWVKGEPVWFNTRPNCRHYFIPITIKQAMGNLNNLKRNLRTKKGSYKEENYQDLKLQRHNERQIRFYKERAKNNEILLARTKDPFMQSQLRNQITRDNRLVREWQARQRDLLKSNPNLERDYRRESTEKMAQDLGVRLHQKKEKGLQNKTKNGTIDVKDDILFPESIAGAKRDKPMTRKKANEGKPNPNFNLGGGYRINCQSCVVAYEARLRGYNVQTLPNLQGDTHKRLERRTNEAWIDKTTGKPPKYIYDDNATTPKKFYSFMESVVETDARYTLEFPWKGRGNTGHIISLDRDADGDIRLYDPQNGMTYSKKAGVYKVLNRIKYVRSVYGHKLPTRPKILRVDNVGFNKSIVEEILEEAKNET